METWETSYASIGSLPTGSAQKPTMPQVGGEPPGKAKVVVCCSTNACTNSTRCNGWSVCLAKSAVLLNVVAFTILKLRIMSPPISNIRMVPPGCLFPPPERPREAIDLRLPGHAEGWFLKMTKSNSPETNPACWNTAKTRPLASQSQKSGKSTFLLAMPSCPTPS